MAKLEALADKLLEAQLEKDRATEKYDGLKAEFIAALEAEDKFNPDTKAVGNVRTKLSPNRYFDVAKASTLVRKSVLKECEVTKVDPKLLQQHLTPIQKEQAMAFHPQAYKLSVEVLTD